jgi:transposase-like protein
MFSKFDLCVLCALCGKNFLVLLGSNFSYAQPDVEPQFAHL